MKKLDQLKKDFKQQMQKLYGSNLYRVLLFGSYARGDFEEDSDIDFMVVLNEEKVSPFKEVFKISKMNSDLNITYGNLISVFPTSKNKYLNYESKFYQSVREEGIIL